MKLFCNGQIFSNSIFGNINRVICGLTAKLCSFVHKCSESLLTHRLSFSVINLTYKAGFLSVREVQGSYNAGNIAGFAET